ncbi:sugar transferase [Dokdonia donghaensis]|uniref:Sugar transferase n=1 Tax=Dokdonia donghaensis DSW-1 TaxID=1300343 RepID=A0A0A2GWV3_9FLAO|nr:sugar transferase [Dokdonia donghaensis]ANH60448.1 UDP-N-acetylgalactosamine-undecaprenyl-phosphate N-acetylgalactosaminephosphotransferase [Dokdonia donghaensis DSW-1]KGO07717.1 sugar transferase [Dokdonia donghaensis DSW-1]
MSFFPDIHFNVSERKVLLRIFDIVAVLGALYLTRLFLEFDYLEINSHNRVAIIVLIAYLSIFGTVFELYFLPKTVKFQTMLKNVILTVSVTVLFYLLTPFYTPILPENRLQIVFFFLAMVVGVSLWRWLYITVIAAPRFYKKAIVVGDSFNITTIIKNLESADPNYKIAGYVNTEPMSIEEVIATDAKRYPPEGLLQTIRDNGISEIIVASSYSDGITLPLYNELILLLEKGFPIREYMQVYEEIVQRVPVQHVDKDFYRYFPFSRSNQNKFYRLIHRVFDLLLGIIGISFFVVFAPFIWLGNLIGNRGPLFYTQTRVGHNGKPFKIIKLRTMIVNAEKDGAAYAQKGDSRITSFGRFLRMSRVDEIPQFFNVILGEMSVIGPRPERPVFVKELSKEIPFYETRHIVKPGLTGWAQVMGSYTTSEEGALEKLQYDLYYIKHRNLFMDLSIILKTISTVINFRGQ